MGRAVLAVALVAALTAPFAGVSFGSPRPVSFEVIRTTGIGGTEIIDVTPDGRTLATTNGNVPEVALFDITNVNAGTLPRLCGLSLTGIGEPTSVAIHPTGKYGLVAVKSDPTPGKVIAFAVPSCAKLWEVTVGIGPDSVVISPNGQYAVVAIEDEENEVGDPLVCATGNARPGRVDILDINGSTNKAPSVTSVPINLTGIAGVNCPSDPQPEGIAIDPQSKVAYVTLQENNALAMIDLKDARVASIISMGTTSHLADTVDAAPNAIDDSFTGRREPDGVAMSADGRYLFTADEGDSSRTGAVFSGGRTMTVLAAGRVENSPRKPNDPPVIKTDTGDTMEVTALANGSFVASRADNRGPEPEGIVAFKVHQTEFAAVALERYNAVIFYDVTNPTSPAVAGFAKTGVGPEGVVYVPSRRLIITSNEVEGSVTFICAKLEGAGCS